MSVEVTPTTLRALRAIRDHQPFGRSRKRLARKRRMGLAWEDRAGITLSPAGEQLLREADG